MKSSACNGCAAELSSFPANARPAAAVHTVGASRRAQKSSRGPLHGRLLSGSGAALEPTGRRGNAHIRPPFRAQLRPAATPPPGAVVGCGPETCDWPGAARARVSIGCDARPRRGPAPAAAPSAGRSLGGVISPRFRGRRRRKQSAAGGPGDGPWRAPRTRRAGSRSWMKTSRRRAGAGVHSTPVPGSWRRSTRQVGRGSGPAG